MTSLADVFVDVRPDTKGFRPELKAALAKTREAVDVAAQLDTTKLKPQLEALKRDLKSIAVTKARIDADSAGASSRIRALKAELAGLNEEVKLGVLTKDAHDRIEAVRSELDSLSAEKVRIDVDSGLASAHLKELRAQLAVFGATRETATVDVRDTKGVNFAFRGISNLTTAFVGLAPIAVPALAAVTAGVGILGSSLMAAAGAGGVFGLAVAGQVSEMKKQQKDIDATTKLYEKYGAGTKLGNMYQDEMNSKIRAFHKEFGPAAKGLDTFKTAWGRFLQGTRNTTVNVIGKGLNLAAGVLPRLVPLGNAAGRAVGGLIDELARFTKGAEFQRILDFFKKNGPGAIRSFAHIAGNLILGVFNLFAGFAPHQKNFLKGFEDMSKSFRSWSEGFGKSGGFQKFMDYAKRVLPQVRDLFSNLTTFVGKFTVALGPLAGIELKFVTAFLERLNSLPPGALTAIAVAITGVVLTLKAWELATKAYAVAQGLATAYTRLFVGVAATENTAAKVAIATTVRRRLAIIASAVAEKAAAAASKVWAAAQWLLNAALDANPIGLTVIAIAALAAGLVFAWKHSETFRKIVTGAFDAVKGAATTVWHWIKKNWPLLLAILTGPFGLATRFVITHFDQIKTTVKSALLWILGKVSDFAVKVLTFFTKAFGLAGPLGGKLKAALAQVQGFRAAVNAELNNIKDEPVVISLQTIRSAAKKNDRMLGGAVGGAGPIPRRAITGAMGGSGILPRVSAPLGPVRTAAAGIAQTRNEVAQQAATKIQDQLKAQHVKALKAAIASGPAGKAGHVLPAGSYSIGMPYHGYPGHNGADYPAPIGTPVSSPWPGRVTTSADLPGSNPYNSTPYRSYGRYIKIQHTNGLQTLYAHLSARGVAAGAMVKAGQFIGRVGMNGNATGPHLHWETARNGVTFNPASLHLMDTGGLLRSGGAAVNMSGRNERMLTPRQTELHERQTAALEALAAGGSSLGGQKVVQQYFPQGIDPQVALAAAGGRAADALDAVGI